MKRRGISLAGPFFNEAERDYNNRVANRLRKAGFKVWMAQKAPFIKVASITEKKAIPKQFFAVQGISI